MDNHIESLLEHWLKHKDKCQWILATIIETQGSAYRKAGAMMLINELGQYVGLVSGGCLESDVMRHANECLATGKNKIITYDMQDDNDISWQLGIGCGGMVKILLQPLTQENNFQSLAALHSQLKQGQPARYLVDFTDENTTNELVEANTPSSEQRLLFTLQPRVRLVIFGAGSDAVPLVNMARNLSWHVTLVDSRPSYGRKSIFTNAHSIIKQDFAELASSDVLNQADVAIIMTHNLTLDGQALALCQSLPLSYCGLLGPRHRTERVLRIGKLTFDDLTIPLFNPVGFDIGGELPESIALSMLSQAHACVYQKLDLTTQANVIVKSELKNAI
ncbi:xanthine and CO dehydrogenase family maturation factor XdhC/CoxF family protein [Thalassotalea loyana]|uniref:Xanthine and CO dehydrogenase family maturation factor XdhC/CoxF family protein n=1 Tax=Thalassotalea loyana TaxID=280483 RepID=A0ABQ6HFS2_9GAMM|nr:XdhC family protein [Thalassotalea loyana]GLX86951.1 xanthine and CO dehydrogenase family maturation factor XdhC/CoxF family protein [Thalassotalea loyana]